MNILVVDDSPVDRHFLMALLEELGHSVETFDSTEGVIPRLLENDYALMFLDIVMPHQDGYKFLRELRANPETADQRVVLYSSKGTSLEVNYGLKRAGANHYIVKPATREKLEMVLQAV